MTIIDAHAHLWLRQDTSWDGRRIQARPNGRCDFLGEERQMLPPYMLDGRNTAEIFLSNMDYARVAGAVITQEFIDGLQNGYLLQVMTDHPDRFVCCGMPDFLRREDYCAQAEALAVLGFRAIKIPGHRLILSDRRLHLDSDEMMRMFAMMERRGMILSIDLAEGEEQIAEISTVIAEHPGLKIAIGHFGCVNRPGWRSQMRLALNPNVMIESGGITWLFNDEGYPFPGAVRAIRETIDTVGADKLMWGSDYPRTIVAITYRQSYDFVLHSPLLTDTEKAAFLGENALRFYGFSQLPELPYVKNMSE